ncbi:MAG: threonylcarbamoyl-AMP synthase [Phycisphaerae bacterium]|nr:threonylcarbamoyl-AMP synthase [Phycisphaerae bacterium]
MTTPECEIDRAVQRLRRGGLVAFPTETVYGLGADALTPIAVARVFAAKGRPAHNPLIVHVTGREMAERRVCEWNDAAERLARQFWPGPLTLVLPRSPDVPEAVSGGDASVAVRCPDHPAALALLFKFGGPLVGPSANRSGEVSPTEAWHVRESFPDEAEVMIIDAGPCQHGIESTVVMLADGCPRVLRPGVVGVEALSAALGRKVEAIARVGDGGVPGPGRAGGRLAALSPGLCDRHYAPRTRAVLVGSDELDDLIDEFEGEGVVLITAGLTDREGIAGIVQMPFDAAGYAARLYAALREADAMGGRLIAVERPAGMAEPSRGVDGPSSCGTKQADLDRAIWTAVADRLARATRPWPSD